MKRMSDIIDTERKSVNGFIRKIILQIYPTEAEKKISAILLINNAVANTNNICTKITPCNDPPNTLLKIAVKNG